MPHQPSAAPSLVPFEIADIPEVIALWRATPGVGLSSADTPPELTRFLERNPGTSFLAREGGRLVGAILGGWDGRRGYIHHLAVAADRRRQGLGQALLDELLGAFRHLGVLKIHLFIFVDNELAIAFYRKRGWTWREDIRVMSLNL